MYRLTRPFENERFILPPPPAVAPGVPAEDEDDSDQDDLDAGDSLKGEPDDDEFDLDGSLGDVDPLKLLADNDPLADYLADEDDQLETEPEPGDFSLLDLDEDELW